LDTTRFQKPRLKNKEGYWIAQYRDLEGRKRKVSLGPVSKTKKYDAERELAQILEPINFKSTEPLPASSFGHFVRQVYLPFYQRKWKRSTTETNVERVNYDLVTLFDNRDLKSLCAMSCKPVWTTRPRWGFPTAWSLICAGTCARFFAWPLPKGT
jgi:hypothetical protein